MNAHASLWKYVIRHIRAYAACICRWRQTLSPLHQHGGLNGALPMWGRYQNHIWWFKSSIEYVYMTYEWSAIVFFLFYGNEIHTCATVKDHIKDKIFKILYMLYHIAYTTIEALLYQPLRFILTFKSNRSMISFGRKHCKYDMHNILACILSRYCI